MSQAKSLYDVLGVAHTATTAEIKAAYRAKAKQCHPDAGGDAEEFHLLSKALRVLANPKARKRYDDTGDEEANAPDNSMAEVVNRAMGAFQQAVGQVINSGVKATQRNLIKIAETILADEVKKSKDKVAQFKNAKVKMEDIERRIRKKDEGRALLKEAMQQHIRQFNLNMENFEQEAKRGEEAISFLREYDFDVEQEIQQVQTLWTPQRQRPMGGWKIT